MILHLLEIIKVFKLLIWNLRGLCVEYHDYHQSNEHDHLKELSDNEVTSHYVVAKLLVLG